MRHSTKSLFHTLKSTFATKAGQKATSGPKKTLFGNKPKAPTTGGAGNDNRFSQMKTILYEKKSENVVLSDKNGRVLSVELGPSCPKENRSRIKLPSKRVSPVAFPPLSLESHSSESNNVSDNSNEEEAMDASFGQDQYEIDVIERAWLVHKYQERIEKAQAIRDQYTCIHEAMEELERVDPARFQGALVKNEVETFPKRLRVAPEFRPSLKTWDYL